MNVEIKKPSLDIQIGGGSGGGVATEVRINGTSITANNIANINTNSPYNANSNKIATMEDIPNVSKFITQKDLDSYQLKSNVINYLESSVTITPEDNTIYQCGTLSSLTITNPPVTGAYSIIFTSGSTATTTVIPASILGIENFVAEANTIYEINVLDNRAVVGSWEITS